MRLFRSVRATDPQLVFLNGDASHTGLASELEGLRRCARQSGIEQFFIVNGNHDLWNMNRRMIASFSCNPRPGYFAFDVYQSDDERNQSTAHFIILDTNPRKWRTETRGFVGKTQLNWLAQQIEKSGPGPLFVLAHHPLRELAASRPVPPFHIVNSEEVWEVLRLRQHGPAFYFCGHTHRYELIHHDNWLLVQHDTPLNCLNFPLVEIEDNQITLRHVPVEGGRETAWMNRLLSLGQYRLVNFVRNADREIYRKEIIVEW